MGIYNKVRTAQRTSADLVAVPAGDWEVDGHDKLEAAVRHIACLAGRGGTESSAIRGQTSALALAFSKQFTSTMWYSANDARYRIVHGVAVTTGPKHDWAIEAGAVPTGSPIASITVDTTEALTFKGELQNAKRHDDVRRRFRALGEGTLPDGRSEQDAVALGLTIGQVMNPFIWDGIPGVTARTALTRDKIFDQLRSVPMPLLARTDNTWTWALSVQAPDPRNTATAKVTDLGDQREVYATSTREPTGDPFVDGVTGRLYANGPIWVIAPLKWADPELTTIRDDA